MTTATLTAAPHARTRALTRTLWTLQILVGLFFVVASAGPKLFGEAYAVEIFTQIGAGQWFRFVIGAVELAGGIGLLVPRLAGAAALGLVGLMVGAAYTQSFVLDNPAFVVTPVLLGIVTGFIAWSRREEIAQLAGRFRR